MTDNPTLYNITIKQPADLDNARIGSLVSALQDSALASSARREGNNHRAPWFVTWLLDFRPDPADLAERINEAAPGFNLSAGDLVIEAVPDLDWLAHSYTGFQPFAVGPFFVYGSHFDGNLPSNALGLQIDAATAFGSGEHGTTAGCLEAMTYLKDEGFAPENILDMGTGSGILSVAACRLWPAPVLAVDIDEESVRVTNNHAAMNGVTEHITARAGDGFDTKEVAAGQPYDLILANILAGPLKVMAPAMERVLSSGGYVILSGMLEEQAQEVMAVYYDLGMRKIMAFNDRGWATLLLQKTI